MRQYFILSYVTSFFYRHRIFSPPSIMAATAVSSYRDRTSEFRHLFERFKKIEGGGGGASTGVDQSQNELVKSKSAPSASHRSEFNKKASRIGLGIYETSQKISRLSKLAKKSSMFDDPLKEIQELTALIKDDITALNIAISDLQTLQNMETADGRNYEDKVVHETTVCDDLKNKLMGATEQFKNVLTTRTENIKAHENRKQIFSANASRENPLRQHGKNVSELPPWSSSSSASANLLASSPPSSEVQASGQLRRRLASDGTPSHYMEASMLQQVVPQRENYTHSRATALQNVESTISELAGIFTHLATVVAGQEQIAIRIDDNMDESMSNVEGARSALVKHLNQISSNRSLMIKIFAILILFLLIFIFFVV